MEVTAATSLTAAMISSVSRQGSPVSSPAAHFGRRHLNITGMAGVTAELAGKSVEIIRELLPSARSFAHWDQFWRFVCALRRY
jgi:hypothetical protein